MTVAIIISFCTLMLIAYLFELTSSKTRIPSVVLLLLLGWVFKKIVQGLGFSMPDFSEALPVLGTIGLILIVLEGGLELELSISRIPLIWNSFLSALFPMVGLALIFASVLAFYGNYSFKDSLTNVIPLCIISSAIAIPSVKNLSKENKEFVIYESSLSDVLGVLIFNFLTTNEHITIFSFFHFIQELLVIAFISLFATVGLSFLLSKIEHHIKFIPIILMVILIYSISKVYHLPGLIFILFFSLAIGNLDELKRFKWIEIFKPEELEKEVSKFKEITIEGTFLVRSLFFLLFGYVIEEQEVINLETLPWALGIVFLIFLLRFVQLKVYKLPLLPLLYIAPRGLITILLFLSIDPQDAIPLINRALIIQVIIMMALLMMAGLMATKSQK